MKSFKLIISVIIVLAMILSLFPFAATASTVISAIDVKVDKFPVIGLTPLDLPEPYVAPGCGYEIQSWYWYDTSPDVNYSVAPEEAFKAGHIYSLFVYLVPTGDNTFSPTAAVTVNGSAELVWPIYTVSFNGASVWSARKDASESQNDVIKSVNVNGFLWPYIGQTAKGNIDLLSVSDNAAYSIMTAPRTTNWRVNTVPSTAMKPADEFAAEKTYFLELVINPKDGYIFDPENLPTVNLSNSLSVDASKTKIDASGRAYFYTEARIASLDPPPTDYIDSIDVEGFFMPCEDATAGENTEDIAVPEGAKYHLTNYCWINFYTGETLSDDDVFVSGDTYYMRFDVEPDDNFSFSPDAAVTIDSRTDLVAGAFTWFNDDGTVTFFTYNIEIESDEPEYPLGDVNGDGDVNLKDILILRRYVAGIISIDDAMKLRADVNGDSDIDFKDILKLRRTVAGLE